MTIEFPRDTIGDAIKVFTTVRVQAVSAGVAWAPNKEDRVFSAPADFASLIITNEDLVAQDAIPLAMNTPRGIMPGYTYTFGENGYIEVM